MTTNGTSAEAFSWKFGFANQKGKYLTAEKFGFKLNVSGTALKAKQVRKIYFFCDGHQTGIILKR